MDPLSRSVISHAERKAMDERGEAVVHLVPLHASWTDRELKQNGPWTPSPDHSESYDKIESLAASIDTNIEAEPTLTVSDAMKAMEEHWCIFFDHTKSTKELDADILSRFNRYAKKRKS